MKKNMSDLQEIYQTTVFQIIPGQLAKEMGYCVYVKGPDKATGLK